MFSPATGQYKVGVSKHPLVRLKQLQTAHGQKLELVEEYHPEGVRATVIESYLHKFYHDNREEGEWFTLNEEVAGFLARCRFFEKFHKRKIQAGEGLDIWDMWD